MTRIKAFNQMQLEQQQQQLLQQQQKLATTPTNKMSKHQIVSLSSQTHYHCDYERCERCDPDVILTFVNIQQGDFASYAEAAASPPQIQTQPKQSIQQQHQQQSSRLKEASTPASQQHSTSQQQSNKQNKAVNKTTEVRYPVL